MTDFIRRTTTRNAATGETSVSETTVSGEAIRISRVRQAEMQQFEASGVSLSNGAVLFFTPDTYGERPQAGDVVTWEEVEWTVAWVNPIAPDGVTIAARVGVRR